MPNIKSAKKRVQLSRVSNEKNKAAKSLLHTNLKKFDAAVAGGNREAASAAYLVAVVEFSTTPVVSSTRPRRRGFCTRIPPPGKRAASR